MISETAPITRRTLNIIRNALSDGYAGVEKNDRHNPSETHAAVLVPFCNVNNKPGVLLEVRGKLRTHSGEVRCAISSLFCNSTPILILYSFPGGKMDEVCDGPIMLTSF